jgi:hypothetical protein
VLIPLAELDPQLILQPGGMAIKEVISSLTGKNWVRRISSRMVIGSNYL